jgi:hypothetical protein
MVTSRRQGVLLDPDSTSLLAYCFTALSHATAEPLYPPYCPVDCGGKLFISTCASHLPMILSGQQLIINMNGAEFSIEICNRVPHP